MEYRAYSAFEVKAMDADKRTFRGWATTPAVDRIGDTINPMGVTFVNPLSLLHQHRHDQPIGLVKFSKPTKQGIEFEAEIPNVPDPGPLKDRLDTAWGEIKLRLVRAVSIGFRSIKHAYRDDGGIDFMEIEVYELSAVSVPALPEAVITSVKSMRPLPREAVDLVRSFDLRRRFNGGILLTPAAAPADLAGAVRLKR